MAKILDPLDSKWRDANGGIVLAQGRETAIARVKRIPCNRRFTYMQSWRAKSAYLVLLWRELSSVDKNQWNWFAVNNAVLDKYGNTIYLNGFDWFMKLNGRLIHAASNTLTTPPPDSTPSYTPLISITQPAPGFPITLSPNPLPAGDEKIVVSRRLNLPLSTATSLYPYWFFVTFTSAGVFPGIVANVSELIFDSTRSFFRAFPIDGYGRSPGDTLENLIPIS